MRASFVIAGVMAVGAAAWIASGQFGETERPAAAQNAAPGGQPGEADLFDVRVRTLRAQPHRRDIAINGRTEESRRVVVRAETAGPVNEIAVEEGRMLDDGQVIARLNVEERRAVLAEAEALAKQRRLEYRAASELAKKGFRSGTKLAEAQAQLEAAQAHTETARIDLKRTALRAPFAGVLETRHVEKGDFVQKGDQVATVVDLDPILAVGYVSERDVGAIEVGSEGTVRTVDGSTASGTIRFVSSVADSATRSFRIELEIANPDNRIRAGLTGKLRLPLSTIDAYLISPAWLTLATDGRIGVRIVNADDVVDFVAVEVLSDTPEGLWVRGIPEGSRTITVGHEFVKAGQRVRPVPETPATAS